MPAKRTNKNKTEQEQSFISHSHSKSVPLIKEDSFTLLQQNLEKIQHEKAILKASGILSEDTSATGTQSLLSPSMSSFQIRSQRLRKNRPGNINETDSFVSFASPSSSALAIQHWVSKSNPQANVSSTFTDELNSMQEYEVKMWLYTWLSKRKIRPNYRIITVGERPKQTFKCLLTVEAINRSGIERMMSLKIIDFSAEASGLNKKEAKTAAAKNFVEYLKQRDLVDQSELPKREEIMHVSELVKQMKTVKLEDRDERETTGEQAEDAKASGGEETRKNDWM